MSKHLFATYPHLASRVFNTALLVHPQKLDAIIAGLGQRLLGANVLQAAADGNLLPDLFSTRQGQQADAGYQIIDGVAVLTVSGALVHKTRMEADCSTLLGYNSIAAQLQTAMDDPAAHAVLQIWDSPGGEAQGAFEYADRAMAMRGKKPFYAIADGMALSAGYLGASAADQLIVTSSGYAGSIGVVMRHVDMSQALANEGVRVSHIFAGSKKVDGNSFEPLSDTVRADFQAEIDVMYASFIDAVVRARNVTPEFVRATQAATYRGVSAVQQRLADRIGTTDSLISELSALRVRTYPVGQPARTTASAERNSMPGNTPDGQPPVNPQPQATALPGTPSMSFTQADLDNATAAGAAAERQRVTDVRAQTLPGHEALIETMAADGKTTGSQAAMAVLTAERTRMAGAASAHFADAPAAVSHASAPSDVEKTAAVKAAEATALAKTDGITVVMALKKLGYAS